MLEFILSFLSIIRIPILPWTIQEINPKYRSPKYSNLISILYDSDLKGSELNRKIRKMCQTGQTNFGMLKFLVKEDLKQNGKLTCRLCGRSDLIDLQEENSLTRIEKFNFLQTDQKIRVATIEHIQPISLGGLKYDPANMTVTCYQCNCERGVKEIKQVNPHQYQYV